MGSVHVLKRVRNRGGHCCMGELPIPYPSPAKRQGSSAGIEHRSREVCRRFESYPWHKDHLVSGSILSR